ncbi:MAG: hypothetical protein JWO60_3142, partial [Frankiales bacterium]|nr:hypothetical protein [Frankiales bacterium]
HHVTTPTAPQLRALFGLRWQMLRGLRARTGLLVVVLVVALLLVAAARSAGSLTGPALMTAIELAPQAFLGFGVLAMIAPLTAGGGNEIVPPDQLVAYPVRPSTQFVGGLVLAPVNLVWAVQLTVLVALTGFLSRGGDVLLASVTTATYVTAMTVLGQALAWTVVGLRQTRAGRRAVGAAGLLLVVTLITVVRTGYGQAALDRTPTRTVVAGVRAGAEQELQRWAVTTLALLLLTLVALQLGARACSWALRRPGDAGAARTSRDVRRSPLRSSALRQLVAQDRRSVWRAPALRRGGLVLALLPGLLAAGAELPWDSLIVVPGLVAAGAGLLFGVNAFCLDGSGAVWMASLPVDPRLIARAKAIVLTETVLATVVISAVSMGLRSPGLPTAAELAGLVSSGLACTAVVVQSCLSSSVRRPHRADLRGPRDAVAPPGALAVASARMAAPAALVGVVMESAASTGVVLLAPLLATPVLLLCGLSVARSLARWGDPVVRARIVQTVSAG